MIKLLASASQLRDNSTNGPTPLFHAHLLKSMEASKEKCEPRKMRKYRQSVILRTSRHGYERACLTRTRHNRLFAIHILIEKTNRRTLQLLCTQSVHPLHENVFIDYVHVEKPIASVSIKTDIDHRHMRLAHIHCRWLSEVAPDFPVLIGDNDNN